MWELDYKESWALKNWCFWTAVLEKTLESPLDCKEIQPVHPKGDQSWVFIGRTDVEAETQILWPPNAKSWLIGKDPDAGKDWGQEEKGMTEDEMVGWHHWLDGHGFGWTPGVGDGQGGLACCNSWGHKESDSTERQNWTELRLQQYVNWVLPDVQSGLKKAEEPENKLPKSAGSLKRQESSRRTSISASLTTLKSLTVWITTNCGTFFKRWEYLTTLLLLLSRFSHVRLCVTP